MVFIHPVIMRDVLSGDNYTRQKYNKLKYAQSASNISRRGIIRNGATVFPDNISRDLIKKMTPEQKKEIIIKEQQQRVLAHQQKLRRAKMAQQRKAAMMQAQQRGTNAKPAQKVRNLPQRLKNVVPQRRSATSVINKQPELSDDLLNGIEY